MGTAERVRGIHRHKKRAVLGAEGLEKGGRGQREPMPRSASALRVCWAALPHIGSEERMLGKRGCFLHAAGWHGQGLHTGQPGESLWESLPLPQQIQDRDCWREEKTE